MVTVYMPPWREDYFVLKPIKKKRIQEKLPSLYLPKSGHEFTKVSAPFSPPRKDKSTKSWKI